MLTDIAPGTGRLTPAELRAVCTTLTARPGVWADLVVRDPDVRWYLPLHRSPAYDVWLLAWERGQDTDWHDHGGSSGCLAVAEGSLVEQYRDATGRLGHRTIVRGQALAFGPGHVHNVGHAAEGPATSIHAYSPALVAMTYYSPADHGLVASQTVVFDGPQGRGGPEMAITGATTSSPGLASGSAAGAAPGIDRLLAEARSGLHRLQPEAALAAVSDGGVIIDIRPLEQRIVQGEVPGAILISRNVLEWRLDPRSEARIPALARPDRKLVVMCSQGYASSLAAASLRRIGLDATDLDGGFQAWRAAGLPTRAAQALG